MRNLRRISSEPLQHNDFRWLLGGRVTAAVGNSVAPVALGFAVLDLTGSVTDLGLVVAARSAANVLLLLVGGVLADRLPRATLMWGSALAAAITQAVVAGTVLSGTATVGMLAALSAVNGAVSAIAFPASSALTPQTVPAHVLRPANALLRLGMNGAMVGGAAVGGLLVAAVGPGWGIAVDAATFALASLCFARVKAARAAAPHGVRAATPLADLREGWSEFWSRTWVWAVVLQFMVVNACLAGSIAVLGPAVADETFGRRAWGFALAAETIGLVVGGLVAMRWQPRRALALGVLCTAVCALPLVVLGGAPRAPLVALALFVAGVAIEQFAVAWDVSLQQHVPPDRLARVYSYDAVGSFVAIPVGQSLIGPVADVVGRKGTLQGAAALVVVVTLATLASRSVRRLEHVAAVPTSGVGV